jgi:hypothetical protein
VFLDLASSSPLICKICVDMKVSCFLKILMYSIKMEPFNITHIYPSGIISYLFNKTINFKYYIIGLKYFHKIACNYTIHHFDFRIQVLYHSTIGSVRFVEIDVFLVLLINLKILKHLSALQFIS